MRMRGLGLMAIFIDIGDPLCVLFHKKEKAAESEIGGVQGYDANNANSRQLKYLTFLCHSLRCGVFRACLLH